MPTQPSPLAPLAAAHGIELDALALERFAAYLAFLAEQNKRQNLTAITEPEEAARKHFLDSLLLLPWLEPAPGSSLLDVGAGAGFPGVPVAIARPDMPVTLLESNGKKARFLRELVGILTMSNIDVICARAEDAARNPALREAFDVVAARGVASLPVLCELCLPFAKAGGRFAAMKGNPAAAREELYAAKGAARLLGGGGSAVLGPGVPLDYGERCCVVIEKITQTPAKYPRSYGSILKKSL